MEESRVDSSLAIMYVECLCQGIPSQHTNLLIWVNQNHNKKDYVGLPKYNFI